MTGGTDFRCPGVTLYFRDANQTGTFLAHVPGGSIHFIGNVPSGAALGAGYMEPRASTTICETILVGRTEGPRRRSR